MKASGGVDADPQPCRGNQIDDSLTDRAGPVRNSTECEYEGMQMKTDVKKTDGFFAHEAGEPTPSETACAVDYKAAPHEVLQSVDSILAKYGLEVWIFEADCDEYEFTIQARGRLTHAELDAIANGF
jgi:hypothetical protein